MKIHLTENIALYKLFACGILVLFSFSNQVQSQDYKHFKITKLSEGVFAAIASEKGYAICNAGIIDLGEATVVIDPFMTPEAAIELKQACNILCKNPVKYVINTHAHNDHIGGNQVFEGATIISTMITRNEMATKLPAEIAEDQVQAVEILAQMRTADTSNMSDFDRKEFFLRKYYLEGIVQSATQLKLRLPELCFDRELELHGTLQSIRVYCWGAGHSKQDVIVFLPLEGIVFTGDLVFNQFHPWLSDGDPDLWKAYLEKISSLALKKLVPGHGNVGDLNSVHLMKKYFEAVDSLASHCFINKIAPASIGRMNFPMPFREWYLSGFIKPNMNYSFNRKFKK